MNKKRMLMKIASFALCAALAFNACGAFSPAYAAGASSNVYTFGNPNGPWPDLYAEAKQREKERKKAEKERRKAEKAAKKKAAKEAREREKRDKAAKKDDGKSPKQSGA